MTIFRLHTILAVAALLTAGAGLLSADPILVLTTPDLLGGPGAVVGWGGSIENNTADWIEISSSQFCVPAPVTLTPAFTCGPPTTGTYSDIVAGNDPIIAPGDTYNTPFDPVGFTTGIGYFTIDPAATGSDVGAIVITFDAYTGDPGTCGSCQIFDPPPVPFDTEASVTVELETPEPGTALFAAPVLLGILLLAGRAVKVRRGTEAP